MKPFFKQTLLLGAVVLACGQANAASVKQFDSFSDGVEAATESALTQVMGSFFDTYTFSLSGLSSVETYLTNVLPSTSLTGSFALYSTTGLVAEGSFSSPITATLAAGDYSYLVFGTSGASTGYYSLASTVTPVPEPETYALFLAGLGAIGFLTARRRSN